MTGIMRFAVRDFLWGVLGKARTVLFGTLMVGTVLAVASIAGAGSASADSADDCNRFDDPKLQVRGCTKFIKQGTLQTALLSVAYTNRGIAYGNLRKTKLAIADFTEAIRLDDTTALPYYNRGNAYYDDDKVDLALADYTTAIAREPEFPLAYYNRGLILEKRGERDNCIADYRKALTLDPSLVQASEGLKRMGVPAVPDATTAAGQGAS